MDSSLTHLPRHKQDDLHKIAAIIRARCPAAQLILLFGSYARGDWKEAKDLAPDRRSGHASDYDILAVTDQEAACDSLVWHQIGLACSEAALSATPRIIHHDIRYLNRKLEQGHYFFSDILSEGRVLYDSGVFSLNKAKTLSPKERLEIARDDFGHWFIRAGRFYELHQISFTKGWLNEAVFNLHQSAESCYKTLLLVFTGYIPDEHYLAILGQKVSTIAPPFAELFPTDTPFQREAFTLLEYAYIGARYDKRYEIDETSLIYLAEQVSRLLQFTREYCEAKIESLEKSASSSRSEQ